MRINRDETAGTFTLIPVTPDEIGKVKAITKVLKPGKKLVYEGIRTDRTTDKLECVYFHTGGIELELVGTDQFDHREVGRISDVCYYGSGGLVLRGTTKVNGKIALVTTAAFCKLCRHPMIKMIECEWQTCDQCSAKCEHQYIHGAIHGGGLDIGVGFFCDKCGRCKPQTEDEKKMTQLDHHLAVERELDTVILYKNLDGLRPSDIAERLQHDP